MGYSHGCNRPRPITHGSHCLSQHYSSCSRRLDASPRVVRATIQPQIQAGLHAQPSKASAVKCTDTPT